MTKLCHCGSELPRRELYDAAGTFCAFCCDDCEEKKREEFDPMIFDQHSKYAQTGEEEDLLNKESDEEYDWEEARKWRDKAFEDKS